MPESLKASQTVKIRAFLDKTDKVFRAAVIKAFPDPEFTITRMATVAEVKDIEEKEHSARMYLTTRRLDHDGDIVMPHGGNFELFKLNPVILFAHDYRTPPIAKAESIDPSDYGVSLNLKFADTEMGKEIFSLVKGGFLNTMSAGFTGDWMLYFDDPVEQFSQMLTMMESDWPEFKNDMREKVRRIIAKWTLLEGSIVPVPSNPYALTQAVSKGALELSDDMRKRIKYDLLVKQAETPPPPPAPVLEVLAAPVAKSADKVTVIPVIRQTEIIRRIYTEQDIARLVEKKVKDTIDKRMGIVR